MSTGSDRTTPTRTCSKCSTEKPLQAFDGKRKVCLDCVQAQRARTIERKNAVAYSDALAERITDALASGMTISDVCAQASYPTARQLRAWRRANPEFDAACELAEQQSAAAHLDRAKGVLKQVEDGKLPASDGRLLFDGHIKLAGVLNPKRYGGNASIDITSAGRPLIDLGSAIKALLDATAGAALPSCEPIDVEAIEAPTLQ